MLTSQGRRRLYSALRPLPVTSFTVCSSPWSLGRNSQGLGEHADLRELFRLLCSWSGLESLTMSGFSAYPRLLMPNAVPAHTFPTYQLVELHLISCELADATLLWLLGNSAASLKRLNISGCSGLTPETLANVFAAVGRTLETLILSVDMDDLANASGSRSLSTDLIKPLVGLRTINLSTDSVFPEEIFHELVALPYLEDISLSYPSFECRIVKDALAALPLVNTWSTLYLDAWEAPDLWDETQRYEVLQLCVCRGVELVLNGLNAAEIEEGESAGGPPPAESSALEGCTESSFTHDRLVWRRVAGGLGRSGGRRGGCASRGGGQGSTYLNRL